jgi:hypothetical protein
MTNNLFVDNCKNFIINYHLKLGGEKLTRLTNFTGSQYETLMYCERFPAS